MTPILIILCATIGLSSGAGVLPLNSINAAQGDFVKFNTSLAPTQAQLYFISWSFGGKSIASFIAGQLVIDSQYQDRIALSNLTGSLELKNVALSDVGEYSVTVRPTESDATKLGLTTLNVYEKITNILNMSSSVLIEGLPTSFICDASGSILTREWMINGVVVQPSDNIVFFNQMRMMFIVAVNRTDTGTVRCALSNPVDSVACDFIVNVNYGPDKVQVSAPAKIYVGKTLKVSCSAESVPAANYTWTKNGTMLTQSREYAKEKIGLSDDGEYTCQATNDVTMKSSEASVMVLVTAKRGLSAGAIAGITIAVIVFVAGLAGVGFYFYKLRSGE